MGIKKTYKRYACLSSFGVIGSARCNVLLIPSASESSTSSTEKNVCAAAALDDVVLWDLRKGEKLKHFSAGTGSEVTSIAKSSNNSLSAGYKDGVIKLWDVSSGTSQVTLSGHKSAVTCLEFDHEDARLVSGSQDTNIIVWDVVNECGLYRLKGHKGIVTCVRFMKTKNILISSSKDTFIKVWDLDTQHCFTTLTNHRSEVWDILTFSSETRLITGSADSELRVWSIEASNEKDSQNAEESSLKRSAEDANLDSAVTESNNENLNVPLKFNLLGSVMRQSRDRVKSLTVDQTGKYLVCHGTDVLVEIFKICDQTEIEQSLKKRNKKLKKKLKKAAGDTTSTQEVSSVEQSIQDEIHKLTIIKANSKIKSCAITLEGSNDLKIVLLLGNNSLCLYRYKTDIVDENPSIISSITNSGHRSDVRTISFSSDASSILSGSAESVKLWNRATQRCIRTLPSSYALCSFFVPGDRHAVVGCKTGELQLFDVASGTLLESIQGHEGAIWGLALAPDKKTFVSGSQDNDVKFWEFELVEDEDYSSSSRRLGLTHVKTLKMSDDVLAVKYSPDQRFLAVALLDSTIKVFYADTLKFFLSLYGHKLPVLCMDISMDGTLLVSGSSDKNIKLWGLDFGDCHKSIFAHDDSIVAVKFVSKTHYFFSVSKDKTMKYWDADKYENIMTLKGHQAEIWCLAATSDGTYLATGSHDKSIRLWERTEELLVVDEEREQEREEEFEKEVAQGEGAAIAGEEEAEVEFAGKKTVETMKAAERLMESIEISKEENAKLDEWRLSCQSTGKTIKKPHQNPLLEAFKCADEPSNYVLEVLRKVKSSELEEALLVLPFTYVIDILKLLNVWMKAGYETELCSRCLFFVLRVHHNEIVSNRVLYDVLSELQNVASSQIQHMKDQIGLNLAGLRYVKSEMEAKSISFFDDAVEQFKIKTKKAKITHYR